MANPTTHAPHLIWSGSHRAWYKPDAHGYTDDIAQAGVFRRPPGAVNTDDKQERQVYYLLAAPLLLRARRAELQALLASLDGVERALSSCDAANLAEHAEERKSGYLREWLKDPAFRAALHSQDGKALAARQQDLDNPTEATTREPISEGKAESSAIVERASRAYDPVGWGWYDRAAPEHPAKPVFLADKIGRMRAAIEALGGCLDVVVPP